ncbi:transcription termination/antitermination protein NusG [Candidatus Falkowbacteria bacterium]|nr:transcription termination/antitermination protein NusG [Candidatus Falkowbacteria bacterium]
MPKQTLQLGRRWYVIHTYSGYEEKVVEDLKSRIVSMGMDDKIFNVVIPTERKIKIKNGKRKVIEEKIFPGYIMVEMTVTDDSWYVVRNTPNVTGFTSSGTVPTPMSKKEVEAIMKRKGVEEPTYTIDLSIGQPIRIVDGPFKNFEGKISEIDETRGKIKALVSMFGRETPVELDFLQVKKI